MSEQDNQKKVENEEEIKMPEEQFGNYEPEEHHSILGPVLGILIVLLILILGGLYLWGSVLKTQPVEIPDPATRPTAEENNEPETNNADAQVQALETVSNSDTLDAIEADIESTNLDELDAELNAIDAELDGAL